jgi:hypothetical protein
MGEPNQQLRGDLRAQDRYAALVAVVGEPANDTEGALWCARSTASSPWRVAGSGSSTVWRSRDRAGEEEWQSES